MILVILLFAVPMLLGLWAQSRVQSAFAHWKKISARAGISGAEVAKQILEAANLPHVEVLPTRDLLGDHYDPRRKQLRLSPEVYRGDSIAAMGIAAHEAGHAIQHAKNYAPLQWRMAAIPATVFMSQMLPIIFIASLFFQALGRPLFFLAMLAFAGIAIFNLLTLPVEFDASRRAKLLLKQMHIVQGTEETQGVHAVLNAAAWTYVAAFVAALGNLFYFFLMRRRPF
ncbi:MAG: zinc metallopeptidase [Chthoniobacterales bacterium]